MELRALQDNLPVLCVQLGERVQVLQGPLSDEVVRVGDEGHEDVHCRLERDAVEILDDQVLEEAARGAVEQPLEAARVQVLQLLRVVVDSTAALGVHEDHVVPHRVHLELTR